MKILYGIQCTGNGHITRSISIIEELKKYVHVDILTSGQHSEVEIPFDVKYRFKGLSYHFGKDGGFNVWETLRSNNLVRFYRELHSVPTHLYDMIISDFEPITAWGAKRSWVYSVGVSNQVSLLHPKVPKPNVSSPLSKLFIKYFCPTNLNYGLSYEKLSKDLYYPPIRREVKRLKTDVQNYYVVYLPFYSDERIIKNLLALNNTNWVVFSKSSKTKYTIKNIQVNPINNVTFLEALASCKGVLCSAGFGTTSEALYLQKKLLVIPMKNQYEQLCNAHILKDLGIPVIKSLKKKNHPKLLKWIKSTETPKVILRDESTRLARKILEDYLKNQTSPVFDPS